MNFRHNLVKKVAVGVVGMMVAYGWGEYEVADQPHVEIDIQPPRYVQSTVITVSGSPVMAASGMVVRVGSASFSLVCSGSVVSVKPL